MIRDPDRRRWLYIVDQSRTPPHTLRRFPVHGLTGEQLHREETRIRARHPEIDEQSIFLRDTENDR